MKTQRREVRIRCIQCHRPFLIWCWYLDHKFEKDIIAVNGQWKRGSQYHHFSSSAAPGLLSLGIWSFVIPRGCQQTYSCCCFHENAFHELMRSGEGGAIFGTRSHPVCLIRYHPHMLLNIQTRVSENNCDIKHRYIT